MELNAITILVLAAMVLTWAWDKMERSPSCVACSGRMRHRADCPNRRDGDA